MTAEAPAIGADFGTATRQAALAEWRRRARSADAGGALQHHPIATSFAIGLAVGLALAAWQGARRSRSAVHGRTPGAAGRGPRAGRG